MKITHDTWTSMLQAVPHHNRASRTSTDSDGQVTVVVKNIRPRYLRPPLSWIVAYQPERRIILDPLGGFVWTQCDGSRPVEAVVDQVATRYALTFHEARAAVTQYIQSLVQRGVLALVIPQTGACPP